ncbi:MAG TPA: hypothetical protein DCY88_16005 [Cyanobacteria bacterium UBA11372]|nr:hypothetical protein [Cyanobacteria bacterium UBA11372]
MEKGKEWRRDTVQTYQKLAKIELVQSPETAVFKSVGGWLRITESQEILQGNGRGMMLKL